MASSLNS